MKWDYLFPYAVLLRGRQYFKQGRVLEMNQNNAKYEATVKGTKRYQVSVHLTNPNLPKMTCTCPYAGDGHKCKHMAAVLFAIDDLYRMPTVNTKKVAAQKKEAPKRVYPFQHEEEEEYLYFDMEDITKSVVFYEEDVKEARQLIDKGHVKLEKMQTGYQSSFGNEEMIAVGYGSVKNHTQCWKANIVFNRKELLQLNCQVPGCNCRYDSRYDFPGSIRSGGAGKKQKLCSHLLALLLLIDKALQTEKIGDSTDETAQRILESYRDKRTYSIAQKSELLEKKVKLEPRLEYEMGQLQLSFRIGKEKMYVVKNLSELVDIVDTNGCMQLGTTSMLDFSTASFDADAEKQFHFLWEIVHGEKSRERKNGYGYGEDRSETIKNKMELYGKRLDDFYDLMVGQKIERVHKGYGVKSTRMGFREQNPDISLTITKDAEQKKFHGITVEGELPELLAGIHYRYFMTEHHLNRIRDTELEKLQPLFEIAGFDHRISFRVGRKNLSEFYYRVLPVLRQCADVIEEDSVEIEKYLPPEVKFIFYLDAEKKDVFCRAKAVYGGMEYDLLDWKLADKRKEDLRDVQRETEALDLVEEFFPKVNIEKLQFECGADADVIYTLLERGITQLMEFGEVQTTEAFRRLKIRKEAKVTVGVSVHSEIMNLEIASEDLSRDELLDILFHYQRKKKYYRLRNGDFLNLNSESFDELAAMFETLRISPKKFVDGKMQLPLYRALYLDKMLEQNEDIYAKRDKNFKQLVKEFKTVNDSEFEIPESLRHIMRHYQVYGHKWLRTLEQSHFGGILADDMGLGKTLQAISVILSAKQQGQKGTSLIISPASLVYNWKEEFARFAPELSLCTVTGKQEERKLLIHQYENWDVLVTSYDLLKRDIAEYEGKQFLYQVIDEAQYIKNHNTAAAKSVKIIKSRTRFALTGTPIENRLSELWSIFDYLMPGFLYTYDVFKQEMETPITKLRDEEATRRLKKMVSPFILRRLKKEVLKDLPDKMEEVRYARMEETQRLLYDGQVVHMQQLLKGQSDEDFRKNRMQVLAELTKIRQICCDPSLLVENYKGESAKRESCLQLIESAIEGEHKMLIFSQFTSMLELLEKDLHVKKISYYKITGSTPKEERIRLVKAFNEDEVPVFLISLKAGGTGLNLTGADIVIHYDPWWNLAVQNQATDRAHRIGQTKVVSVYKLIVKDSIEEKILKMQEAKKDLAEEILNGDMGSLSSMSKEELLELFET